MASLVILIEHGIPSPTAPEHCVNIVLTGVFLCFSFSWCVPRNTSTYIQINTYKTQVGTTWCDAGMFSFRLFRLELQSDF